MTLVTVVGAGWEVGRDSNLLRSPVKRGNKRLAASLSKGDVCYAT